MGKVEMLGRVVRSRSRRLRDTYYQIIGVCLDGRYMLRSPKRRTIFDCPSDMVTVCDDVMYTTCGFIRRGCRVCIVDEDGVFEVHHLSPRRNLVYLTRFKTFDFPFPVRPSDITKIINPVKE